MIFGQGKTPDQIKQITKTILDTSGKVVVTRAEPAAYEAVIEWVPDASYDPIARVITAMSEPNQNPVSGLTVVCAGTSDLPVAMEAILTAEVMGCEVNRIFDVGVAGIHRLFDKLVIGGLVNCPIIAVPTSIGYGASFGGIAALLAMLNSCAPGITVVNIDNGFGAGYSAANIVLANNNK